MLAQISLVSREYFLYKLSTWYSSGRDGATDKSEAYLINPMCQSHRYVTLKIKPLAYTQCLPFSHIFLARKSKLNLINIRN